MHDSPARIDPRPLGPAFAWWVVALGIVACALAMLDRGGETRSFAFDALAIVAASGAVYGILRNRPDRRISWLFLAFGLALFAAGDVVWDVVTRGLGESTGYPWADVLYLAAYPPLAYALYRLARLRFRRDTVVDSAIVALAVSAAIWQWVITPVIDHAEGATPERIVAAAYPVMDVILVVAIVHAVFSLSRWSPAAWLLFGGLLLLLVTDTVYARLVADGIYTDGDAIDVLWPISYFLLAGAALHPSMRELWLAPDAGAAQQSRARMLVLGAALFAAPAVVVIDRSNHGGATLALTAIIGLTAALVAWRIARLVSESESAREVLMESEARFRAFVQHSSDVVGVVDTAGTITYVSPAVTEVFGYQPGDLLGRDITSFVHSDDVDAGYDVIARLADRPFESESAEVRLCHSDGTWRWTHVTITNQMHEPAVRGIVGNFRDVTARRKIEALGTRETETLERILGGAPIPDTLSSLVSGLEDYLGDASATLRLFDGETGTFHRVAAPSMPAGLVEAVDGRLADDVRGVEVAYNARFDPIVISDIADASRYPELGPLREEALAFGFRSFWSLPIRTSDDKRLIGMLAVYVRAAREPSDVEWSVLERVRGLVGVAVDRAEHTEQLGHLALHDTLTSLPNRALAVERLDAALERLNTDTSMVAVLFLDLDRFKVVNDGLGHDTGDELLVAVGRRLAASVRRHDTVARFGGDEFVIICEELAGAAQVEEVAERALGALSEPFALDHAEVVVSASIGVAATRRATDRAASLLRDADAAMYRAKSRGGARYELFDQAMHTQAVTRLLTERGLREALERDGFRLVFQPQFDLATGERVAEEALLRWSHPVRGLVAPGDFMAVAEETGLIVPIGGWVLGQVCERARRRHVDGSPDGSICMSANVSARQLIRPEFPRLVRNLLREFGLDPSLLCLEIAENLLLDDHDTTTGNLNALKDIGVHLAIDDFGTGGSSLTYLRRYPFDELKIDRGFVAGLGQSAADDAIVAATIDMAHALGMIVAAEGVETARQSSRLVELACDRAQGYFLGPPEAAPIRHLELVRDETA